MLCDWCKESIPDGCRYYWTDRVKGIEDSRFCSKGCLCDAVEDVVMYDYNEETYSVRDEMADADYTAMKEGA